MTEVTKFGEVKFLQVATLYMVHPITKEVSTWAWKLAGPTHPKTMEQADDQLRRALDRSQKQEEARINNKKWDPPKESLEEVRRKWAEGIAARVVEFSPVDLSAGTVEYSTATTVELLMDRERFWIGNQVQAWLDELSTFTPGSANG